MYACWDRYLESVGVTSRLTAYRSTTPELDLEGFKQLKPSEIRGYSSPWLGFWLLRCGWKEEKLSSRRENPRAADHCPRKALTRHSRSLFVI